MIATGGLSGAEVGAQGWCAGWTLRSGDALLLSSLVYICSWFTFRSK